MCEKVKILHEDNDIIVAVKPAGVPTQTKRYSEPDMESLLKNHLAGQGKTPSIGIIHRPDQPVEGILVFAKTQAAARDLNRQMQEGAIKKYYLAASSSRPLSEEGRLEDYLERDGRTNMSRVVAAKTEKSRKAVLNYKVLQIQECICYIQIELETGRHHQIRVQSAHHGFPLLGDRKYNPEQSNGKAGGSLALCAYRLEFSHPVLKKIMKFEIVPSGNYFQSFV